jgi:hypothetical protein
VRRIIIIMSVVSQKLLHVSSSDAAADAAADAVDATVYVVDGK